MSLNWPIGFPVNSTHSEALTQCDEKKVAQLIARIILKARAEEVCGTGPNQLLAHIKNRRSLVHMAMDGKILRGTLGNEKEGKPSAHLLSLYACKSGIVLTQEAVKIKENEIKAS